MPTALDIGVAEQIEQLEPSVRCGHITQNRKQALGRDEALFAQAEASRRRKRDLHRVAPHPGLRWGCIPAGYAGASAVQRTNTTTAAGRSTTWRVAKRRLRPRHSSRPSTCAGLVDAFRTTSEIMISTGRPEAINLHSARGSTTTCPGSRSSGQRSAVPPLRQRNDVVVVTSSTSERRRPPRFVCCPTFQLFERVPGQRHAGVIRARDIDGASRILTLPHRDGSTTTSTAASRFSGIDPPWPTRATDEHFARSSRPPQCALLHRVRSIATKDALRGRPLCLAPRAFRPPSRPIELCRA